MYVVIYYPVAISFSILLAHVIEMRLYGLYVAILLARTVTTIGILILLKRINIKEQMMKVVDCVKLLDSGI